MGMTTTRMRRSDLQGHQHHSSSFLAFRCQRGRSSSIRYRRVFARVGRKNLSLFQLFICLLVPLQRELICYLCLDYVRLCRALLCLVFWNPGFILWVYSHGILDLSIMDPMEFWNYGTYLMAYGFMGLSMYALAIFSSRWYDLVSQPTLFQLSLLWKQCSLQCVYLYSNANLKYAHIQGERLSLFKVAFAGFYCKSQYCHLTPKRGRLKEHFLIPSVLCVR